ncbi:MAG: helix-turn-helix domain-containing protein [bacterium]|nr:helix-turn-helix domain-containing protein [bacterium]
MKSDLPIHSFKEMGIEEVMASILHWSEPPKYNMDEIHSHDFYQLLVYRKGGGHHIIDYKKEEIIKQSIHLVARGSAHLSQRTKRSDGFTIAFSNLYLAQLQQFDTSINYQNFYDQSAVFNFNEKEFKELNILFDELLKNEQNRSYFLNILASILSKIILLNKKAIAIPKSDPIVPAFMEFLNGHFLDKNVIDLFLDKYTLSKVVFNRKLKQVTNATAIQLIKEKTHLEAKKLLFISDLSIKEIAYKLQFDDESYFGKLFKQIEGISPNEFRRKCRG